MKEARVLVIDVKKPDIRQATCSCLDDYYRELDCSCFDIARRRIGDKYFDIFCDDEGLFAEAPIVSAIDEHDKPMLVGNLVIANHDGAGNTTSLSDEDMNVITRETLLAITVDEGKKHVNPVIRCCY